MRDKPDNKDYTVSQTVLSILAYGGTAYSVEDVIKLVDYCTAKDAEQRKVTAVEPPLRLATIGEKADD